MIKLLLICEVSLVVLCLVIGALIHAQKIMNKSVLFLDAIRNDVLIGDKRSLLQKSELARVSHDFLSIEFKTAEASIDKNLSWLEFSYMLPIVSDLENPKSDLLGKIIFIYSIVPGIINGLMAWALVSVALLIILPFFKKYLEKHLRNEMEVEKIKELNLIASGVAHDIRSPLSALSMVVSTLHEVPEEKRILIRNATQRINDIANELLQKGKKKNINQSESINQISTAGTVKVSTEFIPALVDILISEKRMQYRTCADLEIEADFNLSFGAFAKVNGAELQRAISNLINNSVEAFKDHKGKITVGIKRILEESKSSVEIFIHDNGKGIPKDILEKLGAIGVTHGKEDTQSGNGLGVFHAKKTIESFDGEFLVASVEGQGTTVKMILPLAEAPPWFAQAINLNNIKYLVSLDDDASIHQIWAERLSSLRIKDVEYIKFQSGEAFELYVNGNIKRLKETVFLVDYELLDQAKTGLQIIDDLGIEKYAVLVTGHHEEKDIQDHANKLNLKILPKALSGFVPIEKEI
jgi:signal transduction histidine kinase